MKKIIVLLNASFLLMSFNQGFSSNDIPRLDAKCNTCEHCKGRGGRGPTGATGALASAYGSFALYLEEGSGSTAIPGATYSDSNYITAFRIPLNTRIIASDSMALILGSVVEVTEPGIYLANYGAFLTLESDQYPSEIAIATSTSANLTNASLWNTQSPLALFAEEESWGGPIQGSAILTITANERYVFLFNSSNQTLFFYDYVRPFFRSVQSANITLTKIANLP